MWRTHDWSHGLLLVQQWLSSLQCLLLDMRTGNPRIYSWITRTGGRYVNHLNGLSYYEISCNTHDWSHGLLLVQQWLSRRQCLLLDMRTGNPRIYSWITRTGGRSYYEISCNAHNWSHGMRLVWHWMSSLQCLLLDMRTGNPRIYSWVRRVKINITILTVLKKWKINKTRVRSVNVPTVSNAVVHGIIIHPICIRGTATTIIRRIRTTTSDSVAPILSHTEWFNGNCTREYESPDLVLPWMVKKRK